MRRGAYAVSTPSIAEIDDDSVDLSVFSPPFASLYTYSPSPRDLGNSQDRDEFFEHFADVHRARLAEQEAGTGAYYVLLAEDGSVLGRFNLIVGEAGVADLGYRVAQHVAGRGVATATVRDLCALAASRHGVSTLRAATSHANVASQRVLLKTGFVPNGLMFR